MSGDRTTAAEQYVMANANRCTGHPQHVMVNQGRKDALFADVFRCDCGEWGLGNTDEVAARAAARVVRGGTT